LYFIKEGCTVGTGVYMREAQAKQLIAVSFVDRKVRHGEAPTPAAVVRIGRQRL
jgi:hypothetical protein